VIQARPPTLRLDAPVQFLKGVGEKRAEALSRLGVRTAGDLLRHVPFRYHDATTVTPIARLRPGTEATVIARVASSAVVPTRSGLRIFPWCRRYRALSPTCVAHDRST
jgi:ATP-dependent DNA helicase RecG